MGNVTHRLETTIGGKRFRLAGPWLPPMEAGDAFDNAEFQRSGRRPQAVQGPSAVCSDCSAPDTVTFVVMVDKTGRVIGAEPQGTPSADEVAAAKATLSQWHFRAAQLKGLPVTDWAYMRIPIVASK